MAVQPAFPVSIAALLCQVIKASDTATEYSKENGRENMARNLLVEATVGNRLPVFAKLEYLFAIL